MTLDFLKTYDLVEQTIRALYDSKLRLAILDALRDRPMRLADLRRVVNANAPNTSTKAKDLEKLGIVTRVNGDFALTQYGNAVLSNTHELFDFYATHEKFKEFWETHDLGGIPEHLMRRLGELKDSEYLLNDPTNVHAVDEEFYKMLRSLTKFGYGVIPVIDPEWFKIVIELLKRSVEIKLVMSHSGINSIKKSLPKTELQYLLKCPKFSLFEIDKEPRVLVAVSESIIDLALEGKRTNTCFMDADLLSFDPRAIQWGLDLFDYYKKQAKPVKLSDYL